MGDKNPIRHIENTYKMTQALLITLNVNGYNLQLKDRLAAWILESTICIYAVDKSLTLDLDTNKLKGERTEKDIKCKT